MFIFAATLLSSSKIQIRLSHDRDGTQSIWRDGMGKTDTISCTPENKICLPYNAWGCRKTKRAWEWELQPNTQVLRKHPEKTQYQHARTSFHTEGPTIVLSIVERHKQTRIQPQASILGINRGNYWEALPLNLSGLGDRAREGRPGKIVQLANYGEPHSFAHAVCHSIWTQYAFFASTIRDRDSFHPVDWTPRNESWTREIDFRRVQLV